MKNTCMKNKNQLNSKTQLQMKKLLLLIAIIATITIVGCSKDDKDCYVFNTTQTTSASPSISGYPQTVTSTTEKCGLTADDALGVKKGIESTSTSTTGGYTITVRITCTYHKK